MEIERLVSGDLNKSIEQCVNLLVDVERKVHALKGELAQTLHQIPGSQTIATPQVQTFSGSFGYPAPLAQGFMPFAQGYAPQGYAPAHAFGPTQGFAPTPPQAFFGAVPPAFVQAPVSQLPWSSVTGNIPSWPSAYALPTIRDTPRYPTVSPYQGYPAYGALPQAFGHGPVQNFGYIW